MNRADPSFVDLLEVSCAGQLVMVPMGGSHISRWPTRLAPAGCPEVHLYDRERPPETAVRKHAIDVVNARPNCRGFITQKRSLENYLHPRAIATAGGGEITFTDDDCVSSILARYWYELVPQRTSWTEVSRRARRRQINRAKRWLNVTAVADMTPALLAERDPAGEVIGWLRTIATMAGVS